jgi:gliding motility-associated-like protein
VPGFISFRFCLYLRILLLMPAVVASSIIQAQLCNGSLGDPAVNITFAASSSNFPPPSGYIYTPSTCPDDGYYTITGATSNCFGSAWHTVTADHTGTGGFLLVNASYTPGDFFLTTVSDLCPNTTYEFAAWIMNVLNKAGIEPNITFSIETPAGIVLQQFVTGNIAISSQPTWKQYGFFFTTPPGNPSIVLRITNNAPGGNGNDLALDDITFRPCGPMTTAGIQGMSGDVVDVCEGNIDTYNFNGAVSSAYLSPVYQWQLSSDKGATWTDIPGANTLSYFRSATGPGSYWYRLTVVEASGATIPSCRIASNVVVINIHPKPLVDAGPDRIMLTGNDVTLVGTATGEDIQYTWSPDDHINDIHILSPTVSPGADISYTLSAVSAFGCSREDNALVKVVTGIYVPSAFTPNNDGKNDTWQIPFLDPAFNATVNVFNRYGQLVYHVAGQVVSWNGKLKGVLQQTGAYVYVVTFKSGKLILKGTVMLIR